MSAIIGLGKKGCLLARQFQQYPQYRVFMVGVGLKGVANLPLNPETDMESYEKNFPSTEAAIYFRSLGRGDEVTLILEGGDPLVGCSLSLMRLIKECSIRVIYLTTDRESMTASQKRDDKIAFGILQEYARSGAVEEICLVSLPTVEELVGDVPVGNYEHSLFYFISYTLATLDFFMQDEAVFSTSVNAPLGARIFTLGVASITDGAITEFRWLYPLEKRLNVHFIYGVPASSLSEDTSLMGKIKAHVKNEMTNTSASGGFSVFESSQSDMLIFGIARSATVQSFPLSVGAI